MLQSPFLSFCDAVKHHAGAASLFVGNRWNNQQNVQATTAPLLLIHGQQDTLIPYTHSLALMEASAAALKRIALCPAASHNEFDLAEDVFRPAREFLTQLPPRDVLRVALPDGDEGAVDDAARPPSLLSSFSSASGWLPDWAQASLQSSRSLHSARSIPAPIPSMRGDRGDPFSRAAMLTRLESRLAGFLARLSEETATRYVLRDPKRTNHLKYMKDMVAAHGPFPGVTVSLTHVTDVVSAAATPRAHLHVAGTTFSPDDAGRYYESPTPFELIGRHSIAGFWVPLHIFPVREAWLEALAELMRGEGDRSTILRRLASQFLDAHLFPIDRRARTPKFEALPRFLVQWNAKVRPNFSFNDFIREVTVSLGQPPPSPLLTHFVDDFTPDPLGCTRRFLPGDSAESALAYLKDDPNAKLVSQNLDYFILVLRHFLRTSGCPKALLRQHTALTDRFVRTTQHDEL